MSKLEKYLVLHPDGSFRWIYTKHSNILNAFHESIGCDCVEYVMLPFGFGCVVDGSGKIKADPQPFNPLASRFYPGIQFCDFLAGSVVFVRNGLVDGESDWTELTPMDISVIELITGKAVPGDG